MLDAARPAQAEACQPEARLELEAPSLLQSAHRVARWADHQIAHWRAPLVPWDHLKLGHGPRAGMSREARIHYAEGQRPIGTLLLYMCGPCARWDVAAV